jgi:hypothetical protein
MNNTQKIIRVVLAVAILCVIWNIYTGWKQGKENFESWDARDYLYETLPPNPAGAGPGMTPQPSGAEPKVPQAFGVSTDLLPTRGPKTDDWSEFAPRDALNQKNFLEASQLIGQNTVTGSLKNPNMSLRADPPIKRDDQLSPWLMSTFDADPLRKKLDC